MKLGRLLVITAMFFMFITGLAQAGVICKGTGPQEVKYNLVKGYPNTVSIQAADVDPKVDCHFKNCKGSYLLYWNTPCEMNEKAGKVTSATPYSQYIPYCKDGGKAAVRVTSGCLSAFFDFQVRY